MEEKEIEVYAQVPKSALWLGLAIFFCFVCCSLHLQMRYLDAVENKPTDVLLQSQIDEVKRQINKPQWVSVWYEKVKAFDTMSIAYTKRLQTAEADYKRKTKAYQQELAQAKTINLNLEKEIGEILESCKVVNKGMVMSLSKVMEDLEKARAKTSGGDTLAIKSECFAELTPTETPIKKKVVKTTAISKQVQPQPIKKEVQ